MTDSSDYTTLLIDLSCDSVELLILVEVPDGAVAAGEVDDGVVLGVDL